LGGLVLELGGLRSIRMVLQKGNPVLASGGGLLGMIDATQFMDFQLTWESVLQLKQRRGQLLLA